MVGNLPSWYDIPWRSNALTYDADAALGFSNLTGGWCEGGEIGERLMCIGVVPVLSVHNSPALGLLSLGWFSGWLLEPTACLSVAVKSGLPVPMAICYWLLYVLAALGPVQAAGSRGSRG